jgi:hypothetical protein
MLGQPGKSGNGNHSRKQKPVGGNPKKEQARGDKTE